MFSKDIQKKLCIKGFELENEEENIWVKEKGDQSITISGNDDCIEAIYQTVDTHFDDVFADFSSNKINEILAWSDGVMEQ